MEAPVLTASTVSWLFASEWAPAADPGSGWVMHVPGLTADGPVAATNLLNIAVWRLRDKDVVRVEQLREHVPKTQKGLRVFNEPSFARVTLIDESVNLPGLQGRLIQLLRENESPEDGDVRRLLARMKLDFRNPWGHVGAFSLGEAKAAGVADLGGKRWHPIRKPVIADEAAYDALRPQHEQIRIERKAYREANEELDNCVFDDFDFGLLFAYGEAD